MGNIVEIHRADKAYRNRTLLLLVVTAALCGVLLWQLQVWLDSLQQDLTGAGPDTIRQWLRLLLAALGAGLAIPAAALGLGLRKLGTAARIEGRFPPRGWKTLRDVRVMRDAPALSWARRTEWAGNIALALALVLLGWSAWAWWGFN